MKNDSTHKIKRPTGNTILATPAIASAESAHVSHWLAFLILALCATSGAADEQDPRLWTNRDGRTVMATLVGAGDGKVSIRMRNGAIAEVAVAVLSETDQEYIGKWIGSRQPKPAQGVEDAILETRREAPRAAADWPRTVSLEDKSKIEVRVIVEDAKAGEFRYESDDFEFLCDSRLGTDAVREFAWVFQATYELNCILPLDLKPRPERLRRKFLAKIYTSREDYLMNGGVMGSAGIYSSAQKALLVPMESLGVKLVGKRVTPDYGARDYRVLIHEITHQVMNEWLGRIPKWYVEGSAEWVELADYSRGRFSFMKHDDNLRMHLSRHGAEFPMVPLEKLMNIRRPDWAAAVRDGEASLNYASALALTYYFYHLDGEGDGRHMIAYLRAIEALDQADDEELEEAISTHLLRGRDYGQLSEDFAKSMRKIRVKIDLGA